MSVASPGEIDVTVTYMEMKEPGELRPFWHRDPSLRLLRITACPPCFYRELYRAVGRDYNWYLRYHWSDAEVLSNLHDPAVSFHVLYTGDGPAGFTEMVRHAEDESVEIRYFGLLPRYLGLGLGRHLLTVATERAWAENPRRVWLHTCSLDHPAAMGNYLARGFRPYKTEQTREPILQP